MGAKVAFSKYQSALIALQDAVAKEREHHRTVAADREAKLAKELRAREKKQLKKGGAAAAAPMAKEEGLERAKSAINFSFFFFFPET